MQLILWYLHILWDGNLIVEVCGGDAGRTGTASFDWLVLFRSWPLPLPVPTSCPVLHLVFNENPRSYYQSLSDLLKNKEKYQNVLGTVVKTPQTHWIVHLLRIPNFTSQVHNSMIQLNCVHHIFVIISDNLHASKK